MSKVVLYVALCARCEPTEPQEFLDRTERDEWAGRHNDEKGHPVLLVKHK